jgi:SAM-dependent methyltransferase
MYDDFSADYDRFVDWQGRLAAELPFIEMALQQAGGQRVLDTACGTGMHAIALAQRGYQVVGADQSTGMIDQARKNAVAAGVDVQFHVAGFGELSRQLGGGFDGVLCLGNSLPHVLTPASLSAALLDFAACLCPGGRLLLQNRNFDAVLEDRERWMDPQSHRDGEVERIFLRFYDFDAPDLITFNVVTLIREGTGPWEQRVTATKLRSLLRDELLLELAAAGFGSIDTYGDMLGSPFDVEYSPNLVVVARRASE